METSDATEGGSNAELKAGIRPKCIRCGRVLKTNQQEVNCLKFGSQWPVLGRIPRFYQETDYYWGEIERRDARALLAHAKTGSLAPLGEDLLGGLLAWDGGARFKARQGSDWPEPLNAASSAPAPAMASATTATRHRARER